MHARSLALTTTCCRAEYFGTDCSSGIPCPGQVEGAECSGHGVCDAGFCACKEGYIGDACEVVLNKNEIG
jgi:hypothetical protein